MLDSSALETQLKTRTDWFVEHAVPLEPWLSVVDES